MSNLPPSRYFPPAEEADADGIVGFGGKLSPEWLLDAYRHGIFPWPIGELDQPMPWFSPDPRAIIKLDRFHVSRRLQRTCKSGRFNVTIDRDFSGVIHGCATAEGRAENTWLTKRMIAAYVRLHRLGHAHSVEVWIEEKSAGENVATIELGQELVKSKSVATGTRGEIARGERLAGGIYGVAIGGLFAAETMFYRVRDASKVALVYLVEHLKARGHELFDIQQLTPHTARFGAIEISRREYLALLAAAVEKPVSFCDK